MKQEAPVKRVMAVGEAGMVQSGVSRAQSTDMEVGDAVSGNGAAFGLPWGACGMVVAWAKGRERVHTRVHVLASRVHAHWSHSKG